MKSVYEFRDYRQFLRSWIEDKSKEIRGAQSRLANAAGVSSTLISRILSGEKQLSSEQATEIAEYVGLNDNETRYFILLVEIGRAGSHKLKKILNEEAKSISEKISVRISNSTKVSDEIKAVYYSSWIYAAIRNLLATPGPHDVNSIAERLGLPKKTVANAVEFLLQSNLCSKDSKGLHHLASKTHLDADSPFITNHHRNWRQKAIEKMEERNSSDLFFSSPMSLSKETVSELRKHLPNLISEVMKQVEPSPSEVTYCFNLDFFGY